MFQPPLMAFSLGREELVATAGFLALGLLIIAAADALRRSVIELDQRAQRERELNLELQHRVNNTLTVIQALARQMVRHAETPAEFYAAFSERLQAIADANKVLSRDALEVAQMPELAEAGRPAVSRARGDRAARPALPVAISKLRASGVGVARARHQCSEVWGAFQFGGVRAHQLGRRPWRLPGHLDRGRRASRGDAYPPRSRIAAPSPSARTGERLSQLRA